MAINELRSISIFVSAAELGSLRKAALAEGITPQAASQALAQLERHLNVRLFHRTTRVMSLTDEGRQFLEIAHPALRSLQRAMASATRAREEIAGPLRIAGPRSAFQPVLWPLIDEFCAQHPDVIPDVQLDDRIGNWVEDRVDVGFRLGVSAHDGVIARRLFPVQLVICAAPAYLQRHGVPGSLTALQAHRCSVYRHPATGAIVPWRVKVGGAVVEHPVVPAICTNDELLELQAVLAGAVIGQLAGVTAAAHIRAGQLVPLLAEHMPDHASYFIYYGSRSAQPVRVRAFIDLAVARLAGNPGCVLSDQELSGRPKSRKRARPFTGTAI